MRTEEAGNQHIWRGQCQEEHREIRPRPLLPCSLEAKLALEEKRTSVWSETAHISSQQHTNICGHGAGDVSPA